MIVDRSADTRLLAKHLGAIGRAIRVHDVHNRAVSRLITWVARDLTELVAANPDARIELDSGVLVVNGAPVRLRRDIRIQLATLSEVFREHGFGGFKLGGAVSNEVLVTFFSGFQQNLAGITFEAMQEWLNTRGGAVFHLLHPRSLVAGLVGGAGSSVRVSASEALQAYLGAVIAVRDARSDGNLERIPPPVFRAVHALADLAEDDPRQHLALAGLKEDLDYDLRHPVHCVILALALGRRIGLDRAAMVEAAFAVLVASTLSEKATADDVIAATASLVLSARLTPPRARRMMARFEVRAGTDRSGPPGVRLNGPLHLYSRIAAIVCDYDAYTTSGSGRRGLLPDEALGDMALRAGRFYDPELLHIFSAVIGRYPLGSAVLLDSGEVGVVFHTPADPHLAGQPVVRIVRDPRGRPVREGPLVDLSDPVETRRISGGVDAATIGVDGRRAIFG